MTTYKRSVIDCILANIAGLNARIGKDSTIQEKDDINKSIHELLLYIKIIDIEFYESIKPS